MMHGTRSGAMTRWQAAGSPRIPQQYNPWVGFFQAKIDASNARQAAQERLDAYSKRMADGAQKGFLARAAGAVSRFFQRRRA